MSASASDATDRSYTARLVLDGDTADRLFGIGARHHVPISVALMGLLRLGLEYAERDPDRADELVRHARADRSASHRQRGRRGAQSRWSPTS